MALAPRGDLVDRVAELIGSPLPPWILTVTLTSNSSFSPPLVNLTENVESGA